MGSDLPAPLCGYRYNLGQGDLRSVKTIFCGVTDIFFLMIHAEIYIMDVCLM